MKKLRSIFLTAAVLSVSLALSACIMSPTSPKDTFVITTENSAVVSWSGAEADFYEIKLCYGNKITTRCEYLDYTKDSQVIFSDLSFDTEYTVSILSAGGWSENCYTVAKEPVVLTFRTKTKAKETNAQFERPANLKAKRDFSGNVVLTWDAVENASCYMIRANPYTCYTAEDGYADGYTSNESQGSYTYYISKENSITLKGTSDSSLILEVCALDENFSTTGPKSWSGKAFALK